MTEPAPRRVLLVEPDHRTARLVRWLLEEADMAVTVRSSEADAVRDAGDHDVVVLDLVLDGGGDGLAATTSIKARWPGVPVVVFSRYAQPYFVAEARSRGADAFLDKATDGPLLADVVASVAA